MGELNQVKSGIIFKISDKGPSIPDNQLIRLKSNFGRISPRSDTAKGSGLGFYIVRKFVQAVNGTIEIGTNEPKGTIFKLIFPI